MIIDFEKHICTRTELVDGIGPWVWAKQDDGAWDGPKQDWEKHHKQVLNLIGHKRTVIQAGGNQGMYPRLLAEHFQHVYTFEPDPLSFYCLSRNCLKSNIYKVQAALGEKCGTVDLDRRLMGNSGAWSIDESTPGHIPMVRLDTFDLRDVDFIWLDVEGYEYKILKGAARIIDQFKPVLMLERGCGAEIKNFLLPRGYKEVLRSVSDTVYKIS